MNQSRFLADNDQPDQLALTLYGMLAAGMTRDTFVSGEAVSLLPVGTAYYRTMYMPPNLGANSSFLETLKLLLVHERRGPRGAPRGLDLAFATPRAWLADGATIDVQRVRTSFGPLVLLAGADRQDDPDRRRRTRRRPSLRACDCGCRRAAAARRVRLGTRRLHVDPRTSTVTLARARRPAAPRRDAQMTFCSRRTAPVAKRSTANCERSNVGSSAERELREVLADDGPLLEAVAREPGRVEEPFRLARGADQRVVVGAHLVAAPPARADPELLERRQPPRGDRRELLERLLAAAERERGALAVEVEAGREVDRQRQLARERRRVLGEEHVAPLALDAAGRRARSTRRRP